MTPTIPGFDYQRVPVADGVALNVAVGGSGRPIVLLHGFPQTHLMWRHVAADLAADHTVICPDLRGYGASDKPAETDADTYAKRTMAADVVALARALGPRAVRAGRARPRRAGRLPRRARPPRRDHPPGLPRRAADPGHVGRRCTAPRAAVGFHLYLMAQPPGLPEQMIAAERGRVLRPLPRHLGQRPAGDPRRVRAAYLDACRAAVPSIVADYRASAGIDVEHDQADRDAGQPAARCR